MLTVYTCTEFFNLFYLISGAIAVEISLINNFFWNDRWTFANNHRNSIKKRLAHYHVISLTGAVADILLLYIFTSWFGIYYLISNFMSIVCVFFVNFIINSKVTWKK